MNDRLKAKVLELANYLPQDSIFSITGKGFDISIVDNDWEMTNELDTKVFMSVECHKRATADLILEPLERRGHFRTLAREDGFEEGSLKWFYTEQVKIDNETQENLEITLTDALQPLINDGFVNNIEVIVGRVIGRNDALQINITITLIDGGIQKYKLFTKQ